jgi:MoaA/NifB/PqqE/SkfB family radical SAM enzyme
MAAHVNATLPHDHPFPGRVHRVYAALTNHCNRTCPWCSTHSSPAGGTWITWAQLEAALPAQGVFDVQLEGGEPTLHPLFWEFVERLRAHPRCGQLILCTNGVALPREPGKLNAWLARLGQPLLVKLSINHHLLEHDNGLIALAVRVREALAALSALGGQRQVVYNVRLRKGYADDDSAVARAVAQAGLSADANVFYLQRYGLASGESGWDEPFLAGENFRMINPDGRIHGTDLIARSRAMARLP